MTGSDDEVLPSTTTPAGEPASKDQVVEALTRRYLMYGLLPTYLATGFLDYLMHRRSDIEHTGGWQESAVHSVEMLEVGVPLVMTMLLEVDPPVLAAAAGGALLHMATAVLDVRLATKIVSCTRPSSMSTPSEGLPFVATSVLVSAYADRVADVFRGQPVSWRLRRKRVPLPRNYLRAAFAGIGLLIVVPYAEELLRCLRVRGPAARITA